MEENNMTATSVIFRKDLLKLYKLLSVKEGIPFYKLANEALAAYLKWIRKAEFEEVKETKLLLPEEREPYHQAILETQKIIEELRRERIAEGRQEEIENKQKNARKAYRRGKYKKIATKEPKADCDQGTVRG